MITFFSHSIKNPDGSKTGSKLLKDHITGVTNKAGKLSESLPAFIQDKELIYDLCLFHDLGKYNIHFQNYLLNAGQFKKDLKQHSKFGGFALYNKYISEGKTIEALLSLYIIFNHHSNLQDFDFLKRIIDEDIDPDDEDILKRQWLSICSGDPSYLIAIKAETQLPRLEKLIAFPAKKDFRTYLKTFASSEKNISNYFKINYCFSVLIEADKLDASDTNLYERVKIPENAVDVFLSQRTNNSLRTRVRTSIKSHLKTLDLEQQKIFTLTAPTGVGKTFTALDVALYLRSNVASLKNAQIVYALPFINIIEQGFSEYNKVLGNDGKILAHYQYTDVFGKEKKNPDFEEQEANYNQSLMELDTWQSDIVITSFVQFFHTLIGYKNKLLKKFNHLANSIVILDEVQTIKLNQLPLIGSMLYYLSKYLNTHIIIMTATKPKLLELAYKEILEKEGESAIDFESLELLRENSNIYNSYKRTKIVPLINDLLIKSEKAEKTFVEDFFQRNWSSERSCLIVVNKVNRCITLYNEIKRYLEQNGLDNPIYCLSTNIVPAHRLDRVLEAKKDLVAKKCPILIATQVVEAGVDLNFDMAFRDLGPIDSIIQVAGRVNRESDPLNPQNPFLPVYIINFGDCASIYGQVTTSQATTALSNKKEIPESDYLTLVDLYFEGVSNKASFDDSLHVFEAIKNLKYDSDREKNDKGKFVSDFALIKETKNVDSVFVLSDHKAEEVLDGYEKLRSGLLSKQDFDQFFKRDFQQRIIAVPNYYTNHLEDCQEANYLKIAKPENYDFETGFKRQSKTQIDEAVML